jgi:hypothetical protein
LPEEATPFIRIKQTQSQAPNRHSANRQSGRPMPSSMWSIFFITSSLNKQVMSILGLKDKRKLADYVKYKAEELWKPVTLIADVLVELL